MDKNSTAGMKLLIGGTEVTKEYLEAAIEEYSNKINSPEFQKEVEEFAEFIKLSGIQNTGSFEYYKLPFPPHTIFKLDREHCTSYRYDESRRVWTKFPDFFTDFEHGNIHADRISFDDGFPLSTD